MEKWFVLEWETTPGFHYQTRIFPAALHVLREFGGLTVKIRDSSGSFTHLIFDPFKAMQQTQQFNWPFMEWEADGSFYPLGCLNDGTTDDSAIAVDGRGRIVLVEFDLLLGSNVDNAIEDAITRKFLNRSWEMEPWKYQDASTLFPIMQEKLGVDKI